MRSLLVRTGRVQTMMLAALFVLGCQACGGSDAVSDVPQGDTPELDSPGPPGPGHACESVSDCEAGEGCSAGVCVMEANLDGPSFITDPVGNLPTDQPPNLDCIGITPPEPEGVETVTLFGAVARFGSGLKTYDIRVEVFEAATFDPSECETEKVSKQEECYASYGSPIGEGLSKKAELVGELPTTCGGHSDCPLGYRCIEGDLDYECLEQYGVFEIDNMPTNTPLVIRSTATKSPGKWHTTYVFNVYLFADNVSADGRYHVDATMVSHGQWLLTPNTVGLSDVSEERGVLGGRVRDCRAADRDSWPISNVTLGLASPPKKFVFFNDLEDDTVPLADRIQTNILGRFAALDVAPGWNKLAGYAGVGTASLEMGALAVYVFPNSLTVVTWPGLQPHWAQE